MYDSKELSEFILGFGGAGKARFGPILLDFLLEAPVLGSTDLCRIMTHHGSDKGAGWHNYTLLYDRLLTTRRDTTQRVFELGIGSNNPQMPFSMSNNAPGASLRAWREYFTSADVYGADLDRAVLFSEDRISCHFVDQLSPPAISALWSDIELGPASKGGLDFDLMIDDGFHRFDANATFLTNSRHHLRRGGLYIVEDVTIDNITIASWNAYLPLLKMDSAIFRLPLPNNNQDNCVVLAAHQV